MIEPETPARSDAGDLLASRQHALAESRLMLLVEAAGQLIESLELKDVLPRILRLSTQLINADAYALWNFDARANAWEVLSSQGLSAAYLANATIAVTPETPRLTGPMVIPDVDVEELLEGRRDGYGPEGIRSLMVMPLRMAGENHGTLTFYYRSPHVTSDGDVRVAEALASLASAAITSSRLHEETRRANEELADANRRLAMLSEASSVLSATLDASQVNGDAGEHAPTLAALARLLVPAFADICVIDVFEGRDQVRRLEAATVKGVDARALSRIHLRDWLTAPGSDQTVSEAVAEGQTFVVEDVTKGWLQACTPNREQLDAARGIAARSIIMAPMRVRGQTIGTLTAVADRTYRLKDVQLIEEVTRRAAIALDGVRLFASARRVADELRDANAAKDEFLGLVSHELKTPITTILGNAEVLDRRFDAIADADRIEALADIRAEAERLHRIIDNLLVLARLEQGSSIEREPMLVRRIVQQIVTSHGRSFPGRVIDVRWDLDPAPVLGSPPYLEQTLRNLISNAEKYSPQDRQIRIEASRADNELIVRVLDEGPGVREDELDVIFTPFYRSSTTASLAQGVGIGLAVCRRLIEAQGGRIWAARRSAEGGSEFGFALPIIEDE
ncbi:MAG: ATP-binding protein [Dehalococcoidia bacterium]